MASHALRQVCNIPSARNCSMIFFLYRRLPPSLCNKHRPMPYSRCSTSIYPLNPAPPRPQNHPLRSKFPRLQALLFGRYWYWIKKQKISSRQCCASRISAISVSPFTCMLPFLNAVAYLSILRQAAPFISTTSLRCPCHLLCLSYYNKYQENRGRSREGPL